MAYQQQPAQPVLAPTDSVAELRYRAALYSQGLYPQQQCVHMPSGAPLPFTATHPPPLGPLESGAYSYAHAGGTAGLPYSAAQAQQAAFYAAYMQQQQQLQLARISRRARGEHSSDSGCSTCSGGRHGDYGDHTDCVSCNSSCSCSSGCDSDNSDTRRARRRRRRSSLTAPSAQQSRRSATSASVQTSPQASAASVGRRSTGRSAAAADEEEEHKQSQRKLHRTPSSQLQPKQHPQRLNKHHSPSKQQSAEVAAALATAAADAMAASDEDDDEDDGFNEEEGDLDDTEHAAQDSAELDETLQAAAGGAPGGGAQQQQPLHVQFRAGVRRRDLSQSVTQAAAQERARIYESALGSITRAEQGFLSFALNSTQAVELRAATNAAPSTTEAAATPLPLSLGTALQRKLLRYEPRGARRPGDMASKKRTPVVGATGLLGSGNLVFYELSVGGVAGAHRFKLSAEEAAEVRRMAEMEEQAAKEADRNGRSGVEGEQAHVQGAAQSSARYARLLKERKGLQVTLEKKSGLIPIRRIRELRAGVVPGAHRLIGTVNAHLDALSIDESELIVPEHCVSLLLDTGVTAIARQDRDEEQIQKAAFASTSLHHASHAAKHEACVTNFAPEVCPRVSSSFGRASRTPSAKLRREVRRNQRKLFANTNTAAAASAMRNDEPLSMADLLQDAHAAAAADLASRNAAAGAGGGLASSSFSSSFGATASPAQAHVPTAVSTPSWIVVATSSREEAHTLINALMFLKLLSGQTVTRKGTQAAKKEVVQLPPTPSASPPHKRSRRDAPRSQPIAPLRLTNVLLSASQHAAQADALAAQRAAQAAHANSQRNVLKRKSVPTPSVHAVFAMPATASAAQQQQSAAAPRQTPVRKTGGNVGAMSASAIKASPPSEKDKENRGAVAAPMSDAVAMQWSVERSISKTPVAKKKAAHAVARKMVDGTASSEEDEEDEDSVADEATMLAQSTGSNAGGCSGTATIAAAGAHDASMTQHACEPREAVAEWLQRKSAEQERTRRRAEAKARRVAAERVAKEAESAAALERWQRAAAERDAAREAAQAKQRAIEAAALAAKEEEKAARRAAAEKAYKVFLEKSAARLAAEAKKANLSKAEAARAATAQKRAAKQRFHEWLQKKSEWYLARVAAIKQRAAERRARGLSGQNGLAGDQSSVMGEDDPDDEARLDWHWLEREVEAELAAASRAQQEPPAPVNPQGQAVLPDGRSEEQLRAARAAEHARDQDLLDGVLDEVDMQLWSKLISGIENARDELAALKAAGAQAPQPSPQQQGSGAQQQHVHVGQLLAEAERERGGPGVSRALPTPLRALRQQQQQQNDPEAFQRQLALQRQEAEEEDRFDDFNAAAASAAAGAPAAASGPAVYNVPLHSGKYERVQASPSSDRIYASHAQFHSGEAVPAEGPAAAAGGGGFNAAGVHQAYGASMSASSSTGVVVPPIVIYQKRPSPFALDEERLAREVQLRPSEHAGTYTRRTEAAAVVEEQWRQQQQQQQQQQQSALSRSASRSRLLQGSPHRSDVAASPPPSSSLLPHEAVRPYEQWLRGEMQAAMHLPPPGAYTIATPHRRTPHSATGATPAASPDVNLLHADAAGRPSTAMRSSLRTPGQP